MRALRLLLDADLGAQARRLLSEDFFYGSGGPEKATDILVLGEFSYSPDDRYESNFATPLITGGIPRLAYRFRPNPSARYEIANEGRATTTLRLEDYQAERVVGLDIDYSKLTWDVDLGDGVKESILSQYHVVELPALRDVLQDLQRRTTSPLRRLLETLDIPPEVKTVIVKALTDANDSVTATEQFKALAAAITSAYEALEGGLNPLKATLGYAEPTFPHVLRSLNLLVTDTALTEYALDRNGLGFNNLLYAAMQIEYFRRRVSEKRAGQLLIIEEPEAHLHPQAQDAFLTNLRSQAFQTVVTTHSAHVTSKAGASAIVGLTRLGHVSTVRRIAEAAALTAVDVADLDRYLDATKAELFFARRLLLVEGGSELLLMPVFARHLNINLTATGISVIAVNGTHFNIFRKLFETGALASRCAIVTDGDAFRNDDGDAIATYDDGSNSSLLPPTTVVGTFANRTTLEFALCQIANLPHLEKVARGLSKTKASTVYQKAMTTRNEADLATAQLQTYRLGLQIGKARFAQRLAHEPLEPPSYIVDAFAWLTGEDKSGTE